MAKRRQATPAPVENQQTLHELQVHKIELEAQNQELQRTQQDLEANAQQIAERNYLLASAARIAHLGTWKWNFHDNSNEWSEEQFHIFGVARTVQPCAEVFYNALHPDDRDTVKQAIAQTLAGIRPYEIECRVVWPSGEIRHVLCQGEVERDPAGKQIAMIGTVLDITERKRMEEALRKSEQEFRTLAEAVPQMIWATRPDGENIYCNQKWVDYTGLTLEEIIGDGWSKPFHPDDQQRARDASQLATQNGSPYSLECRLRRADGAYRWWLIRGVPFRNPSGEIIKWFGTCTDIEDHKHAEEALRESAERLQFVLQGSQLGFWDWNLATNEVKRNDQWANMLGYQLHEIEFSVKQWIDFVHPDDQARALQAVQDHLEGRTPTHRIEYRMRTKDGHYKWIFDQAQVVKRDSNGRALRMSGTHTDIEHLKRAEAERERLEAQNRQLQKAESLGRMAGAIAHHFNNQLQAVMMNLDMATDELPHNAGASQYLAEAMQAARKAAEVSRLMVTYLGLTQVKHELLDLAGVYQRYLPMLRAVIPQHVILKTDLPAPGPSIQANANQLQQVLTNLLTNAWEASGDKPETIRVTVKTVPANDIPTVNRFPIDYQLRDEAYACLEVADAGTGIPESDIEKIFDPFFTTKFTGRGMGLAATLGIVRAHHGAITVESEPGRGSIFRVFIPLAAKAVPPTSDPMGKATTPEMACTVLLVEDELTSRNVVAIALKRMGFTVLTAADGVEAVELFRQHQAIIRCVLCDLTMPRMNGWETLTALRQLAPGLPVILASGYGEDQVMEGHHPEMPQAFLGKPYELKELRQTLARVLAPATD